MQLSKDQLEAIVETVRHEGLDRIHLEETQDGKLRVYREEIVKRPVAVRPRKNAARLRAAS